MRLINIQTLEFEDFVHPPKYAILSHRWQGSEFTYEEFIHPDRRHGPGFEKVRRFCEFLKDSHNYRGHRAHPTLMIGTVYVPPSVQYAWVDTCCIDKRNSSELSEAINSMWDWYWNASFCVAYLADVPDADDWKKDVVNSEWFRRGWTLQELLAPRQIFFCTVDWLCIGSKLSTDGLREAVCTASSVPVRYFDDRRAVFKASVAKRMSWASQRQTTRAEDTAYCLFGLFRVNLPLLYGEGDHAFTRLQEEIIRQTDDESILAWRAPPQTNMVWKPTKDGSILAHHPSNFADSGEIDRIPLVERQPYRVTNKGLEITAPLLQVQEDIFLLRLNCAAISGASTVTELLSHLGGHWHNGEKVVRGCMIPLRRRADGSFLRSHINVWMNNPVASYKPFTTRQISAATVYIRTACREHTGQDLDQDPDFLGDILAITDSDCLWTRTFPGNWFDRFQQQEVASGALTL